MKTTKILEYLKMAGLISSGLNVDALVFDTNDYIDGRILHDTNIIHPMPVLLHRHGISVYLDIGLTVDLPISCMELLYDNVLVAPPRMLYGRHSHKGNIMQPTMVTSEAVGIITRDHIQNINIKDFMQYTKIANNINHNISLTGKVGEHDPEGIVCIDTVSHREYGCREVEHFVIPYIADKLVTYHTLRDVMGNDAYKADYLYFVRMTGNGEDFFKVGRSYNPNTRFGAFERAGYNVDVISTIRTSKLVVEKIEQNIFYALDCSDMSVQYTPKRPFGGSKTECYCSDDMDNAILYYTRYFAF